MLSMFTVPDAAEESFVNLKSASKNHFISIFWSSGSTAPSNEWRNDSIPPDTFRQMPMARHYTTEVKGFRSNPSQRSCLEKGHTEAICKPTLTAPQLHMSLQIYKWSAWLQQHTLTRSVPNLVSRFAVLYAAYIGSSLLTPKVYSFFHATAQYVHSLIFLTAYTL